MDMFLFCPGCDTLINVHMGNPNRGERVSAAMALWGMDMENDSIYTRGKKCPMCGNHIKIRVTVSLPREKTNKQE